MNSIAFSEFPKDVSGLTVITGKHSALNLGTVVFI